MKQTRYSFEQIKIAQHLVYWTVLVVPVSIVIGSFVALFLWLLDMVTVTRWNHLWLIYFLPMAGLVITYTYRKWGRNSDVGNNLILEEIHKPSGEIPTRMAPLVLLSTLMTHLFGGSAGREGTAVQMGGSIAALFSRWYRLKHQDQRMLLMCGMAAGFGAVFGTPVAGAIFAMEVLSVGRIKYEALLPCFVSGLLADMTCSAYGIHHTHYSIAFLELPFLSFDYILLLKAIGAGIAFGFASFLFSETSHFIKDVTGKYIKNKLLIPVLGGVIIVAISYALGTFDYLGLGVTNPQNGISIVSAFSEGGATYWSWFWKLLLTAITLGTGFKGGEVTPLFFIGAALGNVLATISGAPVDLFAGLGFIAVFAGATNTPIACTLMGVELFGSDHIIYYVVVCFTAYYFSGHSGIYGAQRIAVSKFHHTQEHEETIQVNIANRRNKKDRNDGSTAG